MSDHALAILGLIVGAIAIVAGFITSYYFYLKARERVDPRYVLIHQPLVSQTSGAMKNVSVLFNEERVANLNRCIFVIWNRGKKAITRDLVAERDKVRVSFPAGCKALGTGTRKSSRAAINMSAYVGDEGESVAVDFDFLDEEDGGIVEILYQGDPKLSPSITGSILGAPRGIRRAGGSLHIDVGYRDEDDDEGRTSPAWGVGAVILAVMAGISTSEFGPKSPISIILYTIVAQLIVGALVIGGFGLFVRRVVGFPKFIMDMTDLDD